MNDKNKKIIVVDDNPILLELLVDTLEIIGYNVTGFSGGRQVLEELQVEEYDLLVSDIKMPEMDGIELLDKVRKDFPKLPVLFISGVESPEILSKAQPDGFLAKPFRINHIEEQIETCLKVKPESSD